MNNLLAVLIILLAYLLGSISPAYILGKLLRGIDIRKYGSKNAGATNAWRVLGPVAGIITGLVDFLKGVAVMILAFFCGLPALVIFFAGLVAIIGHCFPFYLQFRGGKGAATAYGIFVFYLYFLIKDFALPLLPLFILLFFVAIAIFITGSVNFVAFLAMPVLVWIIIYYSGFNLFVLFTFLMSIYILFVSAITVKERGFRFKSVKRKKEVKPWRKSLRFLAVIFPLIYLFYNKVVVLVIIGILVLIFLGLEMARYLKPALNENKIINLFIKKEEQKKFSAITLFLISSFLTILIFGKEIAITAVLFLIFGDNLAGIVGRRFGITKVGNKSIEGSLTCFISCLAISLLLAKFLLFSLWIAIIGAFAATLFELIPLRIGKLEIDDNLSVALLASFAMWLASFFL